MGARRKEYSEEYSPEANGSLFTHILFPLLIDLPGEEVWSVILPTVYRRFTGKLISRGYGYYQYRFEYCP
eukprot:573443-Pyramimonas_sp.AAC.1